jgi:hypothetical protein
LGKRKPLRILLSQQRACHSGKTLHNGKAFMIEGAPAMLDFDRFLADVVDAMTETQTDSAKWGRFAANTQASKTDFNTLLQKLTVRRRINTPSDALGPFVRVPGSPDESEVPAAS